MSLEMDMYWRLKMTSECIFPNGFQLDICYPIEPGMYLFTPIQAIYLDRLRSNLDIRSEQTAVYNWYYIIVKGRKYKLGPKG